MAAGAYNLLIEQGSRFSRELTLTDSDDDLVDLTNYTARAHLRTTVDSTSTIAELTTENGGITLGGALGTIALLLTTAQTTALTPGSGVWDLEIVDATDEAMRLVEGKYIITAEVTR